MEPSEKHHQAAGIAGVLAFMLALLFFAKVFHLTGASSFIWFFLAAGIGGVVYHQLSKGNEEG